MKHVDLGEPTSFLDHVYLGCTQRECKPTKVWLTKRKPNQRECSSRESLLVQLKKLLESKNGAHGNSWSYDMEGHARKCIERYCELANETIGQMQQVSTPCFDDHQFRKEELATVDELSKVCSQIVLKCCIWHVLVVRHTGTSSHKMQEHVTNAWLASLRTCTTRVITCNTLMWEIRHSIVDWNCLRVLILFKIDPGRVLCIFGSRKLVPLS